MIFAGLTLGLLSGFHCVGMCGPLMLALPTFDGKKSSRWVNLLNYHLGRTVMYGVLGALVGLVGQGIELFTWQRSVAVVGGLMMILMALLPALANRIKLPQTVSAEINKQRQQMIGKLRGGNTFAWFGLGALNGMLPCGALFIALAGALTVGNYAGGALFMLLFGAGTTAFLLSLQLIKNRIGTRLATIQSFVPWMMAVVGCLLILRGMDLGIPFISPSHTIAMGINECH
jgi:sulfite exporter TauE/SafE